MSTEGLPTLEDLFDENFGDGQSDDLDGDQVSDESRTANVTEQPDDTSDGPAKLSDLFRDDLEDSEEGSQSDDDGQADKGPSDLAQEIKLPTGEVVSAQELVRRNEEMRKDYTRKTQSLADQVRDFEAEKSALEAARDIKDMLSKDPMGTIAEMALRAGIIDEATAAEVSRTRRNITADDVLPQGKQSQEDIEALIERKAQEKIEEMLANDPARQQYEVQEAQQKVGRIFDYIESTHGDQLDPEDRRIVLEVASEMGEGNLEYVYLKLKQELAKAQANSKRIKSATPKKSVRGVQPTDADIQTEPPSTLEEAWRRTEAILGA